MMIQRTSFLSFLCLLSGLMLSGCGGGGGSSGGGSSSAGSTPQSAAAAAQEVEDLNVPDDFDYESTRTITLQIEMVSLAGSRSYASVYTRFTTGTDGRFRPDPGSRLANTALTDGTATVTLTVPAATTELLAEVWTIGSTNPVQRVIEIQPVSGPGADDQYFLTD
ncbi:hypothetical protein VA7868_01115 [Vibrio aerogenes CECT 7868]|uniref:Bacterial Ig-like domain-containing protein n=1 Tax=Vibrio aerogenes CECT 7868 TaxID=1216006 RepID=A0A1M5XDW2_9VIBR|nr:hypothetical protein [Vibrio aerogenes]SHH98010.1 hypothetical protein VA7868_01115 [Vibrio aerogenes CECT 7868]